MDIISNKSTLYILVNNYLTWRCHSFYRICQRQMQFNTLLQPNCDKLKAISNEIKTGISSKYSGFYFVADNEINMKIIIA